MATQVTYEFAVASIGTSEKYIGTIGAASGHPVAIDSWEFLAIDAATSNPPVIHRCRRCTTAGTGTAITGMKMNASAAASITSSGKDTITVDPTAASGSPQDGAVIGYTSPYLKTYPDRRLMIAPGDFMGFTIERPGASGTPNGKLFVTVTEDP